MPACWPDLIPVASAVVLELQRFLFLLLIRLSCSAFFWAGFGSGWPFCVLCDSGFSRCHFDYISDVVVVVSRAAGQTKETEKRQILTTNFMHPGILVKCIRLRSEMHTVYWLCPLTCGCCARYPGQTFWSSVTLQTKRPGRDGPRVCRLPAALSRLLL